MKTIIQSIKNNNEDFEFYPTTKEIIKVVYEDMSEQGKNQFKILDIGAGNGNLFNKLYEVNKEDKTNIESYEYRKAQFVECFSISKYAIEKSKLLIDAMPKDIFIVGTDFEQQSLIDKKMDIIFCNPPYSLYEQWVVKIIKEANCDTIYLVIPDRGANSKLIKQALDQRGLETEVLGAFDFLNAERQARANVNLIKIKVDHSYSSRNQSAFNVWFDEHFKIQADKSESRDWEENRKKHENITNHLVSKENMISEIVKMYNNDLNNLLSNYKTLETIDSNLLKELGVNIENLKKSLQEKIEGLKNIYWKITFERLDAITNRLTSNSVKSLTDVLFANTSIDITDSNIYSIIIWTIKNANEYFDKQLNEIYFELASKEAIQLYKSNTRVITDDWRFNSRGMSHFSLDYRIIVQRYDLFGNSFYSSKVNGIDIRAYNFIKDIFTIAKNLGFDINTTQLDVCQWHPSKRVEFHYTDSITRELKLFVDIKGYKNGNLHFRFAPDFMLKLNIEASRINGWVKSPKEASEEMNISIEDVEKVYNSNLKLEKNNVKLLSFS